MIDEKNTRSREEYGATSKSPQLMRRVFHMSMGLATGLIYQFLLTHSEAVYILGLCVCLVYILEQVRLQYPEIASRTRVLNRYIFRAEEKFKESGGVPFGMGLLLTIISFPKTAALTGIYTLAFSDPLSALIGIKYGKRVLVRDKTLAGSAAFLTSTLCLCSTVLWGHFNYSFSSFGQVFFISVMLSFLVAFFEIIPVRLDDNLTIPIFTAGCLWILCSLTGVSL